MKFKDVLDILTEAKEEYVIVKKMERGTRFFEIHFLQSNSSEFKKSRKSAAKFNTKEEAQKELNDKYPNHTGLIYVSNIKPFIGQGQ